MLKRWLKFNFVGGLGIGVQLAALLLFRSVAHLNTLIATALAVETAVIHNFLWHDRFTWRDRPAETVSRSFLRFLRFNATNGLVSIAGNLAIMHWLADLWRLNFLVANLVAITVCSLLNFLLSDRLVFQSVRAGRKPCIS